MASVIQNLLDTVVGDGARSTKFECFINFVYPGTFENEKDLYALVKTSQFPGKSHDVIDLKFKGRTIPIKGQTKYDNTWSCTFYLTQDHKLKKSFEDWIESIDQKHNIKSISNMTKFLQSENERLGYVTNMKIAQMDFHGSQETVIYELFNVFPKSVSAVDVDYSATGTVLEFTVEFSYSHFNTYVDKTDIGTFVDELKDKAQGEINNAVGSVESKVTSVFKKLGTL